MSALRSRRNGWIYLVLILLVLLCLEFWTADELEDMFYLLPLVGTFVLSEQLTIVGGLVSVGAIWSLEYLLPLMGLGVRVAALRDLTAETLVVPLVVGAALALIRTIRRREQELNLARERNRYRDMRLMAYHWAVAIDARHAYTAGHSERVAGYAVAMAPFVPDLSLTVEELWLAGMLHDVGKIGIPDDILNKRSQLTPGEFRVIQNHAVLGHSLVQRTGAADAIAQIVLHHHEWWDGTGYPDRLKGNEIPLAAQVIAVADTFDAMTSLRPYRKPLTPDVAFAEIVQAEGAQFSPKVVAAFQQAFPEWRSLYAKITRAAT